MPLWLLQQWKARDVQVMSSGSNPQVVATASTKEKGEFCLYLPLGEYHVKVSLFLP